MVKVWGVIERDGRFVELGTTERGAKVAGTRAGYPMVGYRDANHYHVTVTHRKEKGKWQPYTG